MPAPMRIGELAQATGVEVQTIRYYEKAGLIAGPARSPNGYRAYGPAHQQHLDFIRHCRALDMTHEEIRALLRFKDDPQGNCVAVDDLLDAHIVHVAERISQLQDLQGQLKRLRAQCRKARSTADCGILEELGHPVGRGDGGVGKRGGIHGQGAQRKCEATKEARSQ